jgi:ABC-2 type transport system ATP-binding protein
MSYELFDKPVDGPGGISHLSPLSFVHVSKQFGNFWANRDITLELPFGQIVGILGPNGAGKSTLLRQLVGLSRPTVGKILVGKRLIQHGKRWVHEIISYLPQHPLAINDLTVEEAIRSTALLRGYSPTIARSRTLELIQTLDLTNLRQRQIASLSGGEHRLVGIASVLVAPTPIIALDEPSNELDPLMRRRVWHLLSDLRHSNRLLLLVSHNVLEAEHVLDTVIIMTQGRVTHQGSPDSLRRQIGDVLAISVRSDIAGQEYIVSDLHSADVATSEVSPGLVEFTAARVPALTLLGRWLHQPGFIQSVYVSKPSLEDVYLKIRDQWAQASISDPSRSDGEAR